MGKYLLLLSSSFLQRQDSWSRPCWRGKKKKKSHAWSLRNWRNPWLGWSQRPDGKTLSTFPSLSSSMANNLDEEERREGNMKRILYVCLTLSLDIVVMAGQNFSLFFSFSFLSTTSHAYPETGSLGPTVWRLLMNLVWFVWKASQRRLVPRSDWQDSLFIPSVTRS